MSISSMAYVIKPAFLWPREKRRGQREQKQFDALTAELQASLAREKALKNANIDLLRRQDTLALEFEHRLGNGLQCIMSLLSLQSRTAAPEAAEQLTMAAGRIAAFGRVHRRLHLLDHQKTVELKQYLHGLCEDLSGLLFQGGESNCPIVVEGVTIDIPTLTAIPLGFIVNELVTNASKYAPGNITVRLGTTSPLGYSLSVLDEGPGLPAGFDPTRSKGLGMKIVLSLVKQIGGTLQIVPADGRGEARLMVTFCSQSGAIEVKRSDYRYTAVPTALCGSAFADAHFDACARSTWASSI